MPEDAPTDIQRLKAMVAQLEASDKPCVEWLMIYFHARRIVRGFAKPQ